MVKHMQRLEDMVKVALPVGDSSASAKAAPAQYMTRRALIGGGIAMAGAAILGSECAASARNINGVSMGSGHLQNVPNNSISAIDKANTEEIDDPLVKDVIQYLNARYVSKNNSASLDARHKLMRQGISFDWPKQLNLYLMPKDYFVMQITTSNGAGFEDNFKIYRVDSLEFFDSFVANGKRRSDIFGVPFPKKGVKRALLGEPVYSTTQRDLPVSAVYYGIRQPNGEIEMVIAIPKAELAKHPYAAGHLDEVVDKWAIHEMATIVSRNPSNYISFLAEFGHNHDSSVPIKSHKDIADYVTSGVPLTYSHMTARDLELIYFVNINGKKIQREQVPYGPNLGQLPDHHSALITLGKHLRSDCKEVNLLNQRLPAEPFIVYTGGNVKALISDQQFRASMAYRFETKVKPHLKQ